jgi:penicillin-binding protein 2
VFIGRLVSLQFAKGDIYDTGISSYNTVITEIPTVRGEITDVNGVVLASNTYFSNIALDKKKLPAGEENKVVLELCEFLMSHGIVPKDILPVSENAPYRLDSDFEDSTEKQKYVKNFAKYMGYEREKLLASPTALYDTLLSRYGLKRNTEYTDEQKRNIIGIRFTLDVNAYSSSLPCVLVENANEETVGLISDSFHMFPGVEILKSSKRVYNIDRLASHLLGKTGPIYAEDAEYYAERGYSLNEIVGKEGAEAAFEQYLRGINGKRETVTTLDGKEVISVRDAVEAKPGYSVSLTIDAEMQAMGSCVSLTPSNTNRSPTERTTAASSALPGYNAQKALLQ